MAKKVEIYPEDAVRVTATYKDFDGNIAQWRDTFYELWRYQMTWSFAYELAVREGKCGVFVDILAKPAYKSDILRTMEALGYKEVNAYEVKVGVIDSWALDSDIDDIVVD